LTAAVECDDEVVIVGRKNDTLPGQGVELLDLEQAAPVTKDASEP